MDRVQGPFITDWSHQFRKLRRESLLSLHICLVFRRVHFEEGFDLGWVRLKPLATHYSDETHVLSCLIPLSNGVSSFSTMTKSTLNSKSSESLGFLSQLHILVSRAFSVKRKPQTALQNGVKWRPRIKMQTVDFATESCHHLPHWELTAELFGITWVISRPTGLTWITSFTVSTRLWKLHNMYCKSVVYPWFAVWILTSFCSPQSAFLLTVSTTDCS